MKGLANRFALTLGIVVLGLAAMNCGGGNDTTNPEGTTDGKQQNVASDKSPLQFDNFDTADVSGILTTNGKKLDFVSLWKKDRKFVEFFYDGVSVGKVDYNSKSDGMFVADANLTAEAKTALETLIQELKGLDETKVAKTFGAEVDQTALGLLFNYADHYATAPINTPLHHQSYHASGDTTEGGVTPMSWGGDGIAYLYQCKRTAPAAGRYAWTYWTDWRGYNQAYLACGLTAPSCEGRCGAGCPCNSWYCANRYYTQDCQEHDWCLNYNKGDGSTDPFAPNCGDEWSDASDDFLFGSSSGF